MLQLPYVVNVVSTTVLAFNSDILPTTRESIVFTGVCHSVHDRLYAGSVAAHPCDGAVGRHTTGMLYCSSKFHSKPVWLV